MGQAHENATRTLFDLLCTAVVVSPMDPWLSREELRELSAQFGVSTAVHGEVVDQWRPDEDIAINEHDFVAARGTPTWRTFLMEGASLVPEELRPSRAFARLLDVFDELDASHGEHGPKDLSVVRAKGAAGGIPAEEIDLALGMLITNGSLERAGSSLTRRNGWPRFRRDVNIRDAREDRLVPQIRAMRPAVAAVRSKRKGHGAPAAVPLDRFADFLIKQGSAALAGWWTMTATELRELRNEVHPTSICVLTGAMLEASLVAVADLGTSGNHWRQNFLKDPPDKWKLGQLIEQARAATTLTDAQADEAASLAELRNRIHAGRFSTGGHSPFQPPHSNAHEATLARAKLDRVLDGILSWEPVRASMEPK